MDPAACPHCHRRAARDTDSKAHCCEALDSTITKIYCKARRSAPRFVPPSAACLTNLDQPTPSPYIRQPDQERLVATINRYEARTNLSALVERASAGEAIIIAKAGRPRARLVPLATGKATARWA